MKMQTFLVNLSHIAFAGQMFENYNNLAQV